MLQVTSSSCNFFKSSKSPIRRLSAPWISERGLRLTIGAEPRNSSIGIGKAKPFRTSGGRAARLNQAPGPLVDSLIHRLTQVVLTSLPQSSFVIVSNREHNNFVHLTDDVHNSPRP